MSVKVKKFYDNAASTLTYVVYDENSQCGVIIDPVLNFDKSSQNVDYDSIEKILDFTNSKNLKISYILDTHVHSDHMTGAFILKSSLPSSKSCIGAGALAIREQFSKKFPVYNEKPYDSYLEDGEVLELGSFSIKVISTPGHTPSCVSYLIEDNLFSGDLILFPDSGTGRCDFPKGDAVEMYHSIKDKVYKLPDNTNLYFGHDYAPGGRGIKFKSSIGEEKKSNIQISNTTSLEDFILKRDNSDKLIGGPSFLFQSLQVNINGGDITPLLSHNRINFKREESS